jgi:hypothetical protein
MHAASVSLAAAEDGKERRDLGGARASVRISLVLFPVVPMVEVCG